MSQASDLELIEFWADKPAPLLPLLHAFHDRDGYLSETALRAVSSGLRLPLAELYGTVSFYHHFSRTPPSSGCKRICTGPICALRGGQQLLDQLLAEGATPMPCAGRCDEPIPVLEGNTALVGPSADQLKDRPTPLPRPNPGAYEECAFAHIRQPDRGQIAGYQRTGGYQGLQRALAVPANQVIETITASKLAGRGGAGFPTGLKWQAVAEAEGDPKSIVCNADEGEPGCFKDRALLDYDPHAIIEAMVIAAWATGAKRGFIYLRYEYPQTITILETALAQARQAGFLGRSIGGTNLDFDIYLRRGAGAYICGEEGSLLNSLEGKHPYPRNRPPFPVTHGFENLPTAVNNVETLVAVPQILRHGADWYQNLGLDGRAGTKIISLSGDIQQPGNYEVPFGLPLQTLLYDWAGGPGPGRQIQAVTMAGLSGGFLAGDALEVTLDEDSIRSKGAFLGAGGIMVFDDSRDMVAVARDSMAFFAEESCGKCFPCRIGTQRLTERLSGQAGPSQLDQWQEEVEDIGQTMMATSACGLGTAAPNLTQSLIKYFPDAIASFLKERHR